MKYALATSLLFLCASACAATPDEGESQAADQTLATPTARDKNRGKVAYYGGRVISNAKVYVVAWGSEGDLKPEVTQARAGIPDFFSGILDSAFMDGLSAFNTDLTVQEGSKRGAAGTRQHIGRGNYAGVYALSSAPSGNVSDEQISETIEAAIGSGELPMPDANTIYAVYFPTSVKIRMEKMTSCIEYRAYHYATPSTQHNAAYLVIPDCGDGYSMLTRVSSHELVEAVTDAVPSRGGQVGATQAWSRPDGTENSDFCTGDDRLVATKLGKFAVQGWSDVTTEECIIGRAAASDFAISTSGEHTTVASGSSKTLTFDTTTIAGESQTLTLSVSAPSGMTATLDAKTVTAGEAVSITLEATAGAHIRDGQVVVTAMSGKMYRSASRLVSSP